MGGHLPLLLSGTFLLVRRQGKATLAVLGDTAVATTVTIGVLVLRGSGDWAEGYNSASLYSFPVVVMAVAFGLLILGRADARSHPAAP